MARALINVPPKAKRGEVIEIKTLISHNMETGFRPDNTGKPEDTGKPASPGRPENPGHSGDQHGPPTVQVSPGRD